MHDQLEVQHAYDCKQSLAGGHCTHNFLFLQQFLNANCEPIKGFKTTTTLHTFPTVALRFLSHLVISSLALWMVWSMDASRRHSSLDRHLHNEHNTHPILHPGMDFYLKYVHCYNSTEEQIHMFFSVNIDTYICRCDRVEQTTSC